MATAMQKSMAARELRKKIDAKDDVESYVIAKIVLNEHLELLASQEPNGVLAFTRCIAAQADWAIEQLGDIEHFDVPVECSRTRMFFCGLVVSGWTAGSDWEVKKRCARTLRNWPKEEADEVSNILRKHLESATGVIDTHHIMKILGEFFRGTELGAGDNEIWRTVFKAIARYSDMQDLVLLGQALYVLQSKETAPLRDAVRHGLAH